MRDPPVVISLFLVIWGVVVCGREAGWRLFGRYDAPILLRVRIVLPSPLCPVCIVHGCTGSVGALFARPDAHPAPLSCNFYRAFLCGVISLGWDGVSALPLLHTSFACPDSDRGALRVVVWVLRPAFLLLS